MRSAPISCSWDRTSRAATSAIRASRGRAASSTGSLRPVTRCPPLAEELWEHTTGGDRSVFDAGWPAFDSALASEDTIELVVQVNGKVRGKVRVARELRGPAG